VLLPPIRLLPHIVLLPHIIENYQGTVGHTTMFLKPFWSQHLLFFKKSKETITMHGLVSTTPLPAASRACDEQGAARARRGLAFVAAMLHGDGGGLGGDSSWGTGVILRPCCIVKPPAYCLLAIVYWLLSIVYWLLSIGYWLCIV
jgi:hypothetical protein